MTTEPSTPSTMPAANASDKAEPISNRVTGILSRITSMTGLP